MELEEAKKIALDKAAELKTRLGVEVYPFVFGHKDGFVHGYIKEPGRLDKMQAIDLYEQSRTQAGNLILTTSLIREESDKRILDEKLENDPIYLGAIDFSIKLVLISSELLKKK